MARTRWGRIAGAACTAAIAGWWWPVAAPAQETSGTSYGRATAQAFVGALAPEFGGLPVPVLFAAAAADLNATQARSRAADVDLGILGMLATTETCGQVLMRPDQLPQPVRAEAPAGPPHQSRDQASLSPGTALAVSAGRLEASATPDPRGEAQAEGAAVDVGGLVTATGGRARSLARSLGDAGREAVASVDFDVITVGPVRLESIHTEAFHRSGATNERGTRFRIGAVEIAGIRFEPPSGDALSAVNLANAALGPLGVRIDPPHEEIVGSTVYLRPMQVRLGQSALSGPAVAPALAALQPLRDQLAAGLDGLCGSSAAFTVADLVAGIASGAGSLAVQFGAAEATSGEVRATNPFGSFEPGGVAPLDTVPPTPASDAAAALPATPAPAASSRPDPVPEPDLDADARMVSVLRSRAGRAGLALLLVLPVLLFLAGRDWLVMRSHSQALVEEP